MDASTLLVALPGDSTTGRRTRPEPPATPPARVSVVVPCYNYGHFLPECLDSILSQPGVDVDVLVIDDASPDGSGEVAEALSDQDSRVRCVRHVTNRGHIRTYNEGLDQVTGEYVVLLSADDLLTPGALGRATALMQAHPGVGLVYGNPIVLAPDRTVPAPRSRVSGWRIWSGEQWIAAQCRRNLTCIYSPEAVVRTSVQHRVGGYDPDLPHSGDLEMWLRIAAVADVGRVDGVDQAYRREHAASMMHTTFAAELDDLSERLKAYETFFAGAGAGLAQRDRHARVARRRVAEQALDLACHELSSSGPTADVGDYAGLAARADDGYRTLPQWREYSRLLRADRGGAARSLAGRRGDVRRNLQGRLRWQRWYRLGV